MLVWVFLFTKTSKQEEYIINIWLWDSCVEMLVCDLNYRHGTQQRKFGCRSCSEICQHLHGTESLIVCGIIKENAFNKNKYLGQGLGNRNCKGWLEEESDEKEWNKCRRKIRYHKLNRNKEKRASQKREWSTTASNTEGIKRQEFVESTLWAEWQKYYLNNTNCRDITDVRVMNF